MSNKHNYPRRNRYFILSILIVLVATLTPGDGKILGDQLDKVAHFLIFAFLALNVMFKYDKTSLLFWCILLGFATEILQQFVPGRNLEFYDALADTFGVILAFWIYTNFQERIEQFMHKIGA